MAFTERLFTGTETRWGRAVRRVGYGAGTVLLGGVAACAPSIGGSGAEATTTPPPAGASAGMGNGEAAPPATPSPTKTTITELADNRNGVPVFANNQGAAPEDGVPGTIPYGTGVEVSCYEPNESGMGSVNYFYQVEGGQWDGHVVPANTMDNGAGLGPNPVTLDPRVPEC